MLRSLEFAKSAINKMAGAELRNIAANLGISADIASEAGVEEDKMTTDLVLDTLLAVHREIAPDLDEELVRQCYEIQKKHQFDRDRGQPTQSMDRLIDEQANKQVGTAPVKAGRA